MLLRRRCSRVPHVLVSLAKGPSGRADLAKRVAITSQVGSHRGGSGTGSGPLLAITTGQPHILDFAAPRGPLHSDNRSYNHLITALRAPAERGNARLGHWRALARVTVCPHRISTIAAAALVLTSLERGTR